MIDIIFITGASSDIGVSLIKSIDEPCIIIAHYNENIQKLLNVQEFTKNKIIPIQANFSINSSLTEMLDKIEAEFGVPNKIIHLVGSKFEYIRFNHSNWGYFQNELNLSLMSIIQILSRFLPKMGNEKVGRVITMLSSVTIGVPPKALSHYTTVKYALLGLMKALAVEYANRKITINCISPSMVETQFLSNIDERIIQMTAESHPLKRNAIVSDILPVIHLLLSEDSAFISGANIPITGGNIF
jgi:3-oxoacyl-[acyl-carrier protein] reductase